MYGLGDAMMNGIQGWRMADQDMAARDERDYVQQKRQQDDQWTTKERERKGVQWGREDQEWDAKQAELRRQEAIRSGLTAYTRGKMTGDYSGLTKFLQDYDEPHGPNIVDVQGDDKGNLVVIADDGKKQPLSAQDFVNSIRRELSPENWLQREGEKEMVGVRAEAQKDVNTHQGGITRENAEFSAGLENPGVVTTYGADGSATQRVFKGGKEIERIDGMTPEMRKAMTTGSGKPPSQLDVDKFFAQLSAKQFGVPDANGNLMLDETNGAMKSKVEALASLMHREYGDKFTPLQHFARALKYVRDNPVMSEKDAMKKLAKEGKDAPGFWASKLEEEQYMREVSDLVEQSNTVPTSASQRGAQPQGVQTGGMQPQNAGVQSPQTTGANSKLNIITDQVPHSFSSKMQVGVQYRPSGGPYAGRTLVKQADGSIQLIE